MTLPQRLSLKWPTSAQPLGWDHPTLRLHRRWHQRRSVVWRSRLVVVLLLPALVLAVTVAQPLWLLLALLGLLLPLPLSKQQTLREIEAQQGQAYTSALTAPSDAFGLHLRLARQAQAVTRGAELPAWPLGELAAALLVAALFLVLPRPNAGGGEVAQNLPTANEQSNTPAATALAQAAPVLSNSSQGKTPTAPNNAAADGRAANGGTPVENGVGKVGAGGGASQDDPEAVSQEFLDALERGAVREGSVPNRPQSSAKNPDGTPKIENRDGAADDGAGGNGPTGQDRRNGQNGQNGQNNSRPDLRNGQNRQNNQGQGQGNNQGQGKNGQGQNNQGQNNQGQGGNGQNNQGRNNDSGQGRGGGLTPDDQNGVQPPNQAGSTPGQGNSQGNNSNNQDSGRGGRNSGGKGQRLGVDSSKGKLDYLSGDTRAGERRGGALQLPGDPNRPLTGTPGSTSYQRAVESAVLDPRLPPEYQELVKNYYK
jgi:hypothetical protein